MLRFLIFETPYFTKEFAQNTKVKWVFQFFAVLSKTFLLSRGFPITWINLSDLSFSIDAHIGILCDILCRMAYVIKCQHDSRKSSNMYTFTFE